MTSQPTDAEAMPRLGPTLASQVVALALSLALALAACGSSDGGSDAAADTLTVDTADTAAGTDTALPTSAAVLVTVRLDGVPTGGILVFQGGSVPEQRTDDSGQAVVVVDMSEPGDYVIVASHPEARIWGDVIYPEAAPTELTIDLARFDRSDNPDYDFQDPGEPGRRDSTAECGHCHTTFNDLWVGSGHRAAASNPWLTGLYTGAAEATDAQACRDLGGTWATGRAPGTNASTLRCFVPGGVLEALNPGCTPGTDCEAKATAFGDCADCHAPGIDGALGGRDLLDATGHAYDYGVHCDVCHKVESVDLAAEAGVAGRLGIMRPSEASTSPAFGAHQPLSFGPSHDVLNPRMGMVQRDHFRTPELCAGCHELISPVLVPGASADTARWPDGRLPIHTTYSEWKAGPMNGVASCQSCHMRPAPALGNGADIPPPPGAYPGIPGGWVRPQGSVRRHDWPGPAANEAELLALAAAVYVEAEVVDGALMATVTTENAGAGHAIPTGEPMRALIVEVDATCGVDPLPATGGDAIPDIGGYDARRTRAEGLTIWPGAAPGDVIRVVARPGGHYDYTGFGPFGDGTFDAAAKGMPRETVAAERVVVAVDDNGSVTLDGALPDGEVAYRVRAGADAPGLAGAPGFAFARVLEGAGGRRMVPHYAAVDVASDNRLPPRARWASRHEFALSGCEAPAVTAKLWYRRAPRWLAAEQGWDAADVLVTSAVSRPTLLSVPKAELVDDTPSVVKVSLQAAALQDPSGYATYGYNGQSPGPTIRVPVGTTLEVTLDNALDTSTTIHWHGMRVPWEMDGATWRQEPVAAGGTFVYRFIADRAGTFWYHPHFDTEQQVDRGLYGVIVVEDPADPAVDEDLVWVFDRDDEVATARGAAHLHDPARASSPWRVNGDVSPTKTVPAGSVVRARILNASNGGYLALRRPGAALRVIAGDQGLAAAARELELLVLAPGDRAELEWLAGAEELALEAVPYTIHGGLTWGAASEVLRVKTDGVGAAPTAPAWGFSGASPTNDPGHTDVVYVLAGSDRTGTWVINGERFPDVTVQEVALGEQAVIEVRNLSSTEHPFHLHGSPFEVLSLNGVAPTHKTVEDTINLPIGATARLLLRADNPGDWMAHCHILSHAEDGMMTVLRVATP